VEVAWLKINFFYTAEITKFYSKSG